MLDHARLFTIALNQYRRNAANGIIFSFVKVVIKQAYGKSCYKFEELVPADSRSISPVNGIILVDKSVSRQEVCKSYSSDSTSSHNL